MIAFFRHALQEYSKKSNTQIVYIFGIAALIALALTWLYVHFIGQHQAGNIWLSYLTPILLFLGGVAFVIVARVVDDPYSSIGYAVLAVLLLFGAVVSFILTLLLYLFVY